VDHDVRPYGESSGAHGDDDGALAAIRKGVDPVRRKPEYGVVGICG
jgi:hypothetical protein